MWLKVLFTLLPFILVCPFSSSSRITDQCKTCKDFVENFHKGMKKTAKNHFGGGDTAWEESRLGSYARSETRLLEILEGVCNDVSKEHNCHAMVEQHEEKIEEFWFNKHSEFSELQNYLCIKEIKVCCPPGKYGKKCKDCSGGSESPCSGKGKCKGEGTRGGNGKCDCDKEYDGENCEECSDGYYNAGNNTCNKCHESCASSCTDGTNKGCDECKGGYIENTDQECVDKNECKEEDICKEGTFCFNTKGSFRCEDCDPACDGGCTNTGRLSCINCNPGWKLREEEGKGCYDINECETPNICAVGTHCLNNEGSYKCEPCHLTCENGCTGYGPEYCHECAKGYKMVDEKCVDVDECKENRIVCSRGQVCVNRDGPDECEACHISCMECSNTSPNGCFLCNPGFMLTNGKCEDKNECEKSPCDATTEKCINTPGSFKCNCKKNWLRTKKGHCIKKKDKTKSNEDDNKEEL